jgi:DNA repair protein RecN (Recombination protein N)
MLLQLEINNIALIDNISIELGSGLNVLTGETGAGKSILIDSINAVLGERVSKELIRTGTEKASVEAVFCLEDGRLHDILESLGILPEEDGTLILSREFSISGKNTCRVNGKLVTVSVLKEIGERLIDIHGQHDNQSLLRTESHIDLLDAFVGEDLEKLKQNYSTLLHQYREFKSRLKSLSGDKGERERKIDLLKFQIEEIRKARLKTAEEEELNKQRLFLSHAEKIINALSNAYELLYGGTDVKSSASDNLNGAAAEIHTIVRLDEKFGAIGKKLEELSYQLEDVMEDIRSRRDSVEYSPKLLEQIEERLDLIFKLKRKYGASVEEVLAYCRKIEQELELMTNSEEAAQKLQEEIRKTAEKLYAICSEMNRKRREAAAVLESRIGTVLEDLEMKKARFKVEIVFDDMGDGQGEKKFQGRGLDKVEFLISANVGEPLKPLSKIASGGEMSRIMLAIKTILADVDCVPTLIFDEIDIGISGKVAQKVGEKLDFISAGHQVVCVTHLAQIACMADDHYLIEKIADQESTRTQVTELREQELAREIARMIGGISTSDITMKHAEEMLTSAKALKQKNN